MKIDPKTILLGTAASLLMAGCATQPTTKPAPMAQIDLPIANAGAISVPKAPPGNTSVDTKPSNVADAKSLRDLISFDRSY